MVYKYLLKFSSNKKKFQTRVIEASCGNEAISKLKKEIKSNNNNEIIEDISYMQLTK